MTELQAQGICYKNLNEKIFNLINEGHQKIKLVGVNGQRYIGTGIASRSHIIMEGTPGNDMAAYMNGSTIEVFGNAQDAAANTMNDGEIIIHGHTGDTLGYAMRGGTIYVRDYVGYRVGIHMKEYEEKVPVIVVGGNAGDFLGEYMAGGILIVLGLNKEPDKPLVGNFCGTGMHGGVMYLRGQVQSHQLGREVKVVPLEEADRAILKKHVAAYAGHFKVDYEAIMREPFFKLIPFNKRPYGNLYAAW
ncbi:MAG: hypothetical protein SCK28_15105 [Bacillota bacterium]|nr:hypothetical protein [Bacillota bacterium]